MSSLLVAAMMAANVFFIHEQLRPAGRWSPRGVAVAGGQGDQQPHSRCPSEPKRPLRWHGQAPVPTG